MDRARTRQARLRLARHANGRDSVHLQDRRERHDLLRLARPRQREHDVVARDHAEVAMAGFGGVYKQGGRSGRGQSGGDLAPHMATFAHAHHHDTALGVEQGLDRRHKLGSQSVRQGEHRLRFDVEGLLGHAQHMGWIEWGGLRHELILIPKEAVQHRFLVVFAFALINMNFESLLSVLGPLNYNDPVAGPKHWSYNLAGLSCGMLIGGIWILKKKLKRPLFIAVALIALSAVWDLALAFDLPLYSSVIAAFLAGITTEIFMVTWATSLQHHVPEESYSRVASYDTLGSFGIAPLGIVFAGPLAMHFGVNTILLYTGVVTFLAASAALFVPAVRNLRND